MKIKLWKSRRSAEKRLGVKFSRKYATDILVLCKRKLQFTEKGDDYLPILYESELVMKFYGGLITETSAENKRKRKEVVTNVC